MAKNKDPKDKGELPMDKFVELPESVIRGQVMEVFTPEIRENYDIRYIKDMGDDTWLVRLVKHPLDGFKYQGKEKQ